MKSTILIVEDDTDIMEVVTILLRREGFSVLQAQTGEAALGQALNHPDLIILDIMLPDMDGYEVCRKLRENTLAPVLFLTAKGGLHEKTEGLEAGGDDREYRGKEQQEPENQYLEWGGLRVNKEFNEVAKNGEMIEMTDLEYKILKLLMQYRNKIFSIQNIYESVWEKPYYYDSNNTVMVHIRRLRMAIEDDPRHPAYIRTEWGRGYRFVSE